MVAGALLVVAVGALLWWRLGSGPSRPAGGGGGLGLATEEANRVALRLAREDQPLAAIPYFREVIRQDPRSSYAHENLASALGNGAQEARTHLGKTDNAVRSSVERVEMLRESLAETVAAERLATTQADRVLALMERGRALETWGFPLDALVRFRKAREIAPQRADVRAAVERVEGETESGAR